MKTNQKLLLIVNPCAGQRRADRVLPELVRMLIDGGFRTEVYITASAGDATRFVTEHAEEFDRIICVGGDGTLNETIAGIRLNGCLPPIGYIPAGTTNDYASSIGLSADLVQAASDAVRGDPLTLDLGSFNGRTFIYTASCGAFTRVSYTTPQPMKNLFGHAAYILAGITDLSSLQPHHLRVETPDQTYEEDYALCCVTNSTTIGGVLKLDIVRSALNDGLFEILLVRHPTNAIQLGQVLSELANQEMPGEMLRYFKAAEVRITSDQPLEWTLDGERADPVTVAEIRNLHSAFTLIVPPENDKEADPDDTEDQLSH